MVSRAKKHALTVWVPRKSQWSMDPPRPRCRWQFLPVGCGWRLARKAAQSRFQATLKQVLNGIYLHNIYLVAFIKVDKLIMQKYAHRSEPVLCHTSLSVNPYIIPPGTIIRQQQSVAAAAAAVATLLLQWHHDASSLTRCQGMKGWSK